MSGMDEANDQPARGRGTYEISDRDGQTTGPIPFDQYPFKPPIQVKIVSKGHPWDAKIVDVDTGAILANVVEIKWHCSAGQEFATTVITLCDVPVELEINGPGYEWIRPSR